MSSKKLIAFDLDGTLAPSKSPLPDRIGELLSQLLQHYQVCVISGGRFGQFEKQLLTNLKAGPTELANLHIMPTCGTRYYKYDMAKKDWAMVYAEDLTATEKKQIMDALTEASHKLGYDKEQTYGQILEDRESQITWSALGQDIVDELGEKGLEIKHAWDPDNAKKQAVRDYAAELLPEFEVRVGGVTSVDITKPGIDKAYGMRKLIDVLEISKDEILFMGDKLQVGGNDYPVKEMGIDSIEVSHWEDTAHEIEGILHVS